MDYDRTTMPEVYRAARTLGPAAMDVWTRAVRAMLPPAAAVERVLDLGCGTGRFTGWLAELLQAPVVGVDPSRRMLAEGEASGGGPTRFLAASAEALPLADRSVDLVFASMVYHHLRPQAALPEARRVLRGDGHLMIRNPTRESLSTFTYFRFFPEALAVDEARMPSRRGLIEACAAAGFALRDHEVVRQPFAADHADYYRKISLRGLSGLVMISDEEFARGLREFAAYCQAAAHDGPIYESVELFLFAFD
jgi:ubiquinone/menaquinone biosynthesis C-methylase UbiE